MADKEAAPAPAPAAPAAATTEGKSEEEKARLAAERKARKEAAKLARAEKKANRGKPKQQQQQGGEGEVTAVAADGKKFVLKTPKGTRDYDGAQMRVRDACIELIKAVFKRHGAVTIDTPVFELRDTLMGKYGEDSKLIYDLQDQGGELCSLRYDLTVPFARYLAMNHISTMRRYQIAKVYRRDNPATTRGRFREFYQCDFDIAGTYDTMVADAECLSILCDVLCQFALGDFVVKLNHRKLLDGIFEICGVPTDKLRPIGSAVDKLDKLPWDDVRREMVETKGLAPEAADRIKEFVLQKGPAKAMLETVMKSGKCAGNAKAEQALRELETLFRYTDAFGITQHIQLDLGLARGLDYYTGVVLEAVLTGKDGSDIVGSVAGGGRYDDLVGIFGGERIPAVGFSVGLERIFAIAEMLAARTGTKTRDNDTQVYVVSGVPDSITERMAICAQLWAAGIPTEFVQKTTAKLTPQLSVAQKAGVPVVVLFGEDELAQGTVVVKDMVKREQVTVPRSKLAEVVREKLAHPAFVPVTATSAPAPTKDACGHTLKRVTFTRAPMCAWCGTAVAGVSGQGYVCDDCEASFHIGCAAFGKNIPCKECSKECKAAEEPAAAAAAAAAEEKQ